MAFVCLIAVILTYWLISDEMKHRHYKTQCDLERLEAELHSLKQLYENTVLLDSNGPVGKIFKKGKR